MSRRILITRVIAVLAAGASAACSEDPPVAPDAAHHVGGGAAVTLEPFTFRGPLDPYRIHQLPAFLMHSNARTDIVMQRNVFAPGPGMWHTHPGPSFVYVIEGEIKVDRFIAGDGCTSTLVFRAGDVYSEVANEVHRAVVMSPEPAVVLVTRFNIPVGAAITVPAADPGC